MNVLNILAVLCGALLELVVTLEGASACACCTNQGQRRVGVEALDKKRDDLSRLRFSADAQLYYGEGNPADIKGIEAPSASYELHVSQESGRWAFHFRDKSGRSGMVSLSLPATASVFEVDPRLGEREGGHGPILYKEWRLTSKAVGSGIFRPGMGTGQSITLILQGHGNSCTSSDHFSHWTLVISGPKAHFSFIGEFLR